VDIEHLLWFPPNEEKLRGHGISRDEVDGMILRGEWVVYRHDDYPEQVRVVGTTPSGRLVTVAMHPTGDPAVWRPITGWPSSDWETAYYWDEYR
jgi:uncharacterized DUF497 family protein